MNYKTPLFLFLVLALSFGCMKNEGSSKAVNLSGPAIGTCGSGESSHSSPLITVKGKSFHLEELPTEIQNQIYETNHQAYERNKSILETFALQYSKAYDKNKDVNIKELPPLDSLLSVSEPSEKDIKEFYEQNKNRMPPGVKFEDIKPRLVEFMKSQQMRGSMMEELEALRKKGEHKILITMPASPEVKLNIEGFPTLGNKNAKNVLVEASDYTCGHCKMVHPQVKELVKELGDKIKFVQMNFSLRPSGKSGEMIRGAFCAKKENVDKFWNYHNKAFESDDKNEPSAETIAKEIGLDLAKFKTCLNSPEAMNHIQKTNDMLNQAGVSGTPTFFLNNRKLHVHGDLINSVKENLL